MSSVLRAPMSLDVCLDPLIGSMGVQTVHLMMRHWSPIWGTVADLPSYGYRRAWSLLRRATEAGGSPPINAKQVYRVMRAHGLLLARKPRFKRPERRHDGRVAVERSNKRWCSDGFEFRCDNGEPLCVTFALDCCDREAISWAATTAGHSGEVVRDVMLAAVERRFGASLKASTTIEWLTDNGSGYIAERTRSFALELGLKPQTTPVCSPQSNGMAESFVENNEARLHCVYAEAKREYSRR